MSGIWIYPKNGYMCPIFGYGVRMAELKKINESIVELFKNCSEFSRNETRDAEVLIEKYMELINARTPELFLKQFNSPVQREYSEFDVLILSIHEIMAKELEEIEKLLVRVENAVSSFQDIGYSLLQEIMERLYAFGIVLSVCNIGEKLKILDMLYRIFGIILYFRITQHACLIRFAKILLSHCGQIRKSYILFLEILLHLIENFDFRNIAAVDSYLLKLNGIEAETQEELSFLLLLKGLLNYYRGKMNILIDIYEQYVLLSPHSYVYLNEYFCLKVSLGAMTLSDFSFSYGIIQSFRIAAKYKERNHVAIRWLSHLAFLVLHKRNFVIARQCIQETEKLVKNVFANVPASFIRRAKAYYWYLQEDYKKAVQILNEDSERSFVDGKFIAPMTDPRVMEMMYDLQIIKGFDLGNYNVKNLIDYYLADISCVTRGIAYYWLALLAKEEKEKKNNLEKAFEQICQTGCIRLIEQIGFALLSCLSDNEKIPVREKIEYWQLKKNSYASSADNAPFYSTYNCLNMLLASKNNAQNYFNIQHFLLILQKELGAQRVAFFEVDEQKELCLGTINISSIEIEKFSLSVIKNKVMEYLTSKTSSPEYYLVSDCIGIFCFSKNKCSTYVLYLENDLKDGIFLSFNDIEKKAFSWFLYCYIRSNVSRFQQNSIASSYHSVFKYKTELEPFWGDDMVLVLERVRNIAYTDISILITGETGVGKEQLAVYIHKNSRADMPFICVHLASIPLELFESELFGHEKGSFTGALQQKKGVFELAHNGTLFLDEIADVPMQMQIKLLRVLQNKKFNRVGGNEPIFSDFRLIVATNKDLWKEVTRGNFREDLYYRISMVTILIPPLRERKKDFPLLVQHIHSWYCTKYNKEIGRINKTDYQKLYEYDWKGNIRELCSVLEKYVVLGEIEFHKEGTERDIDCDAAPGLPKKSVSPFAGDKLVSLEELEKQYIAHVLEKTNGKIYGNGGALEILKMKKSTFYNRLEQYGIRLKNTAAQ